MVTLALLCLLAHAKKDDKKPPNKKDLPYIACEVCRLTIENAYEQSSTEHKAIEGKKMKLDEEKISDILDNVCQGSKAEGEWLRKYDIVEKRADKEGKKTSLLLTEQETPGKCGAECSTISKSCSDLLEEDIEDRDELQSMLYANKVSKTKLVDKVCKSMTSRCAKSKSFSAKVYERQDEEFEPVTEKDLEMERLMASMEGMGMGGMSMYGKDDLEDMMAGGMGGMGGMGMDDMMGEYGEDMMGGDFGGMMGGMGGMGMDGGMEL